LSLCKIKKAFWVKGQEVPILSDISFFVRRGEIIGLVGPSGIGKTTLLNIIAGEVPPDSGTVTWEQGKLSQAHKRSLHAAMIFQEDAVFPWMRVIDNVAFSRTILMRGRKSEILREAAKFLSQLGLESYSHYWPRELSGGMRKRVELARAVFSSPSIILLDEPFSMLDALTRLEVHVWFTKHLEMRNLSAILVTHDIREAIELSDRVFVISGRPASIRLEVVGARQNSADVSYINSLESSIKNAMTRAETQ
jgi:NitT/TauT family transport system ATP-binding protein